MERWRAARRGFPLNPPCRILVPCTTMRLRPGTADPDPETGDDLLVRYRDGDAEAFDRIVAEFQPRLVQFFHRLCWDVGRAEDLTQTLFMKLLRGAQRYRPEGKLATYVFRVATNLWIDHYRANGPKRRLFSLDQAVSNGFEPTTVHAARSPDAMSPVDAAEQREERARLRSALEQLTEPHRLVFELAVYQELPYLEVGKILDIPVGTVKSRMHNSVKALKELLAEEAGQREATFRGGSVGSNSAGRLSAGGAAG